MIESWSSVEMFVRLCWMSFERVLVVSYIGNAQGGRFSCSSEVTSQMIGDLSSEHNDGTVIPSRCSRTW